LGAGLGRSGANAHVIGHIASADRHLAEVAFVLAGETSDPTASFGSGASAFGAVGDAIRAASASIAAIARREGFAFFVFFAVVFADHTGAFALAFVIDRDTCAIGSTFISVSFAVATADGFVLFGAALGLGFANARIVHDVAGANGIFAEVAFVFASPPSDPTAIFFDRASHLCTSHSAIFAEALVATIRIREGFAVFVLFAVVLAACACGLALAFVIDRNTRSFRATSIPVSLAIATAYRIVLRGTSLGFWSANAHVVGHFAGSIGHFAEVTFVFTSDSCDPTAFFSGRGDTGFQGTSDLTVCATRTGVAAVG